MIEPRQAGETVACSCGRQLTAPSMRGIRELEIADELPESTPAVAKPRWNSAKGAVFAVGAIVTIFGVVFTLLHVVPRFQVNTEPIPRQDVQRWLDESNDWDNQQLWVYWISARDQGLPKVPSPYQQAVHLAQTLEYWAKIGLGITAAGLVLLVCPLFVGGRGKKTAAT
jgi:hypothetical protein